MPATKTYDRKVVLDQVRKQHPELKDTSDDALSQALGEEMGASPDAVIQALGEDYERQGIKLTAPKAPGLTAGEMFHGAMEAGPLAAGILGGPMERQIGGQIAGTAEQLVGDAQAVSRLPKTLVPAVQGKATPEMVQDAAHGIAAIGGLAGGTAGAMIAGPAGAEMGGPLGAAVVGGAGAGLLGGALYSAERSPGDQPLQTGIDALLGSAMGAVTGTLFAHPAPPKVAPPVAPEPAFNMFEPHEVRLPTRETPFASEPTAAPAEPSAQPLPELRHPPRTFREVVPGLEPTSLAEKPITRLRLDVPPPPTGVQIPTDLQPSEFWSRVSDSAPELDLNKLTAQARDVEELPVAMDEASKRSMMTTPEQTFLKAQDIVDEAIKEQRKTAWFAGRRAELLKKTFTEPELSDMSFAREGTKNPFVPGDTPADVQARLKPQAKDALRQVGEVYDHVWQVLKDSGYLKDLGFVENYISHLYVGKVKFLTGFARRWTRSGSITKERFYSTLDDAMSAGLTPRTTNIAELLQYYENLAGRIISTNRMVEALKVTPTHEGTPMLTSIKDAPAGYKPITHPVLGGTMAVHPDAYRSVNFALQEPMSGTFPTIMSTLTAYAKKAALSFSLFHHLTLTEQAAGALGMSKPQYFLPPNVIRAAARGLELLDDPSLARELLDANVNLSAPGDVQIGVVRRGLQDLEARTRQAPALGQLTHAVRSINDLWDDVLWNKYYNGLKAITYFELKEHYMKIRPDVPEAQIRAELGEAMNNIYGGQNWNHLFGRFVVDPQVQQAMHWAQLAPDWTLSNMAAATQAVSKRPIIGAVGRRALAGHALYVFTTTQLLNYVFTSMKGTPHFTWDNDPGQKMNVELPWTDPKGRKLYMSIGKSIKEVIRWFTNPVEQLGAKVGPVPQEAFEQLTGYTTTGFPTSFNPQRMIAEGVDPNVINQLQARVLDTVEKVMPLAFRGNNAFMAFPLSEGMTPYKTVQMYEAALRDHDYARIAVITQHAKENHINVGLTFSLAQRNVGKFNRTVGRNQRELQQQLEQEQSNAPSP